MHDSFQAFVDFNVLDRFVEGATKGDSQLDLVLISSMLCASNVIKISSIANSDRKGQLFSIVTPLACSPEKPRATLDYARLDVIRTSKVLRAINWSSEFNSFQGFDALVAKLQFILFDILHSCTPFTKRTRKHRKSLPKSILRLINKNTGSSLKIPATKRPFGELTPTSNQQSRSFTSNRNQNYCLNMTKDYLFKYINNNLGSKKTNQLRLCFQTV